MMTQVDEYTTLSNEQSELYHSRGHASYDHHINEVRLPKKRSLSLIPEDKSCRFEASQVLSVFSGRGVGAGGASVEKASGPSLPYTRRQLIILTCVMYGNFWVAACVSLQAPFFPMEAESKGASSTVYGLIFGVYELLIITMSPVFGKLITKIPPNYLVQAGLLLCGLSTIIFGVLDQVPDGTPFILLAFIVRIFEGVGAAAFLTSSYTICSGEFPTRVATIFALLETCFGLGLILGPTVGGALYQASGYYLPFVVLGSFLVLGGVIAFWSLPKNGDIAAQQSGGLWAFLMDKSTLLDALATATSLNFIGFNAATFEPHLRQFELTPLVTGCLFILTGAVYALTSPLMGRLCEKGFNEKSLCLIGCVLVFGGSLFVGPIPLIPFEPQLWVIIVSMLVIGLGLSAKLVSSFVDCLNYNIKVRGYPDEMSTYGMVSALFFSSCSVGAFIGPSAGGYLLDNFGYRWSSMYIVLLDAIMIILFVLYKLQQKYSNSELSKRERLISTGSLVKNRCYSQSVHSVA